MALAEDLVSAVFEKLCPPEDRAVYTPSEIEGWRRDAELAVETTLRGLAHGYETEISILGAGGLRHLADEVGRGGRG